jgi:hypothetical protein
MESWFSKYGPTAIIAVILLLLLPPLMYAKYGLDATYYSYIIAGIAVIALMFYNKATRKVLTE